MKIMFMGTPEISASCLQHLLDSGAEIIAAVTGEDKPRGRKMVMTPTAVKTVATEAGIPVYTPKTLKDGSFMEILRSLDPDIIVVVAYGKILPREVLEFPPYGCINLHVSLLPKYRGAAPMQRAIIEGETVTGVTVMQMDVGLDTGDIISSVSFPIGPRDNFGDIHDRSCEVGGELLIGTLRQIESGEAVRTPQNDAEASYAAKIEKAECKLDFTKSAKTLDCLIRGVTPIPGAFAYLNGKMLKIYDAIPFEGSFGAAGTVVEVSSSGDGYFTVACGEGALKVLGVIPEGKGKMTSGDLIRGRKINKGDILQ